MAVHHDPSQTLRASSGWATFDVLHILGSLAPSASLWFCKLSDKLPDWGAGNDGLNDDVGEDVPSDFGYEIILPVAASTTEDEVALFSNYGRHTVLLAAPGTSIVSTVPNARYFVYAVRLPALVPLIQAVVRVS